MMMYTVAVLLLSVVIATVKSITEQEWISAEVIFSTLESATNVTKEEFAVTNLIHCIGLATSLDWVYLACFSSSNEGVCTLWDIQALGYGYVKTRGDLDHSECKARRDVTGCFVPGKIYTVGEAGMDEFCPANLPNVCTETGLELQVPVPPLTTCETAAGFVDVSGMCLLFVSSYKTWCESRENCRSLGADLASFETVAEFQTFRNYVLATNILYESHVGLTKDVQGVWSWMFFGRDPGTFASGDWTAFDPGPTDLCARVVHKFESKVGDLDCNIKRSSVCRVYL